MVPSPDYSSHDSVPSILRASIVSENKTPRVIFQGLHDPLRNLTFLNILATAINNYKLHSRPVQYLVNFGVEDTALKA